jgi:hypothetical protein
VRRLDHIRKYEVPHPIFNCKGEPETGDGCFLFLKSGIYFFCISSNSEGWDHVSVTLLSRARKTIGRCPTWEEMCWVKDIFFAPEEAVMQLHPPKSDYVNNHNFCLHLWRPHGQEIPLPPKNMVGVK